MRLELDFARAKPVIEEELAVAGPVDPLQELLGHDLVGVDVVAVEHRNTTLDHFNRFHGTPSASNESSPVRSGTRASQLQSLMSTKWPSTAAAAAILGLTRCVRPPAPCRPSKFRFEVEAQRSPGCRMSGFIPRQAEQPDSRHSKPAARKTSCSPSSSACAFTCWEPGTTIPRRHEAILRPSSKEAASRRSEMREFVQDPMKIRSSGM